MMETVKIGWAKREISMDEPVKIPGQMYTRISEGIHDPLYVTALCVDGGADQDKVIFLSCDVVTVTAGILQPIQELLNEMQPEIPEHCFILSATHTHSSITLAGDPATTTPDGATIFSGAKAKEIFIRKCAEAICEAWNNRQEGGIGYGYGFAVVAHSRRVVYFEERLKNLPWNPTTPAGTAVMYGETNDPLFSHYEAGADHFLNLMFTFDKAQKLTGIVVNVPCPSQLSEHFKKQSADFWNEVRQMVAKEYGPDVFVLPQAAAAGDLSPRVLHYKEAQIRRMRLKYGLDYDLTRLREHGQDEYNKVMAERYDIAERILEGIRDVYGWAKKDIQTQVPVRHHFHTLQLERRKISDEEVAWCKDNLEKLEAMKPEPDGLTPEEYRVKLSFYNSRIRRNTGGVQRAEEVKQEPNLPMDSHVVQIGDVAFATIRFELYQDFMHRLQARSPFIQTFVMQMAGTEKGNYLATKRAVAAKGYSASMFCNMVSADGGQQWVDQTLEVLHKMKNQDKQ